MKYFRTIFREGATTDSQKKELEAPRGEGVKELLLGGLSAFWSHTACAHRQPKAWLWCQSAAWLEIPDPTVIHIARK